METSVGWTWTDIRRNATLMSYQLTKLMNLNATVWSSVGLWCRKMEAEWNLLCLGWNWMNGHEMLNFLCSSIEDFWFSWDSKPLEVKRTRNTLRGKLCKKRFRLWLCKFSWNSFCRLPPLSLNVWQSLLLVPLKDSFQSHSKGSTLKGFQHVFDVLPKSPSFVCSESELS